MDVDHALREARQEARIQQLHVAREHDELDPGRLQPVGHRQVAGAPVLELRARERPGGHAGAARPLERPRLRLVGAHGDDLDAFAPVDRVEDGLEIRALAGGEDADLHAASSTG